MTQGGSGGYASTQRDDATDSAAPAGDASGPARAEAPAAAV